MPSEQGCQIFLIQYTKTGEIYQIATKLQDGHKMYQMAVIHIVQMVIEYTKIFHSKSLQNLPEMGFLV
jgi:hypothetical protein